VEVERERGVVIEEWRGRRGADARIQDAQWPAIFGGSRYADRLPIGTVESLRGADSTRLVRFGVDAESALLLAGDDGLSRPLALDDGGVVQMQGAVIARDRYYVTTSHGPWRPGSVYAGQPGSFTPYKLAVPMGPEDLAYWPSTDRLWSVSEHPRRRWIFSMRRTWFD